MLEALGLGSIGGGIIVSKLIDYFVPFSRTPQGKLFKEQKKWQEDLENERMNFQERMETRRLRCQENIERQRLKLQEYLQGKQIETNREIALFQARAMRQTQMQIAQENARNVLQDHLLQDALRTFPLNVSPLVLLKNQSQSLGHLLAFSEYGGEKITSIEQVYEEVEAARRQPDALNIFVAPVHIDSKIKNRKVLSDQIWDTVYQRIESFFTLNYNRSGDHPVIFYPTAWNDKYNPGMHAAETLHYFLKDLPCIVIEPRFDGTTFRMMFSAWGLGYNSTLHHRTELSFPVNIDAMLACAVYERSCKAMEAIKEINDLLDAREYGFGTTVDTLQRNIDLFQALHIEERMKENRMEEIDALGIYNIFKVEPVQDLSMLADYLSARIGLNLAVLADIHHLRSYDRDPILPGLLHTYFPNLYENKDIRNQLFMEYEKSYNDLRREEIEYKAMKDVRTVQIENVKRDLGLSSVSSAETAEKLWRDYAMEHYNITADDFDEIVEECLYGDNVMQTKDIPYFEKILNLMDETDPHFEALSNKLFDLKNS